jgi:hypothetical protein
MTDEQTTLFHIINRQQRRQKKMITEITDEEGNTHTTLQAIRKTFYQELSARFAHITVHEKSMEQLCTAIPTIDEEEKGQIEKYITYQELRMTVIQVPKRKSPGKDGISSGILRMGIRYHERRNVQTI